MSFICDEGLATTAGSRKEEGPGPSRKSLPREVAPKGRRLARIGSAANGQRDTEQAAAGLDPAAAAARGRCLDLGADRLRRPVRGGADRVLRLPHVSDVRLVLRAAVGPGHPAPASARLPRVSRSDRAPAGDRVRSVLLDLRPVRRTADGVRVDRLVRGGRGRHVPAGAPVLRPGRRSVRGAARAEPVLRREPRRAGVPGHLLRRADRVGDRVRGRTASAGHARVPDARRRRAAAPGCVGAERRVLVVVRLAGTRRRIDRHRSEITGSPIGQPAVAVPRPRPDRPGRMGRRGRDRNRQSAVLAAARPPNWRRNSNARRGCPA